MIKKKLEGKTKQPPVAKCSICGQISNDYDSIDKACKIGERICHGVFSRILYPENWHECDICSGTGRVDDAHCKNCIGSGWIKLS